MKLQEATITPVSYTNDKGATDRVIIPVTVPSDLVKAVDVTDLPPAERERIRGLVAEFAEYRARAIANLYNLETFIEHQTGTQTDIKWRSFKTSGLE